MYPRVPLCVPVKTLVGSGVDTCNGLVLACDTSSPCYKVENYCASVEGFWSTADEYSPDSDITCKITRYKKLVRRIIFCIPEHGCIFGLPVATPTSHNYLDTS